MTDKLVMKLTDIVSFVAEVQETYNNDRGLSIRKFITTPNYTGPTKQGVIIPSRFWNQLKEFVDKLEIEK